MITEITEQEYESLNQAEPKLIEFYSKTCGPCKMLSFVLKDISKQKPEFPIYIIDFDENRELKERLGVKGFPTMLFFKDGQEFLPGIQALAAPGHTIGHSAFMITSEGKTLCAIGDTTHHQVLLFEKPLIEFAFDTDPKQAAATRVRILDMLAADRIPMIAYHFPWPGIGYAAKSGAGFRYHQAPMQMVL